jgi:hypothetical protein
MPGFYLSSCRYSSYISINNMPAWARLFSKLMLARKKASEDDGGDWDDNPDQVAGLMNHNAPQAPPCQQKTGGAINSGQPEDPSACS